ncbi:ParA family protein [Streptomyces sp. CB03238]|uniref:ParA family protein n=1 Tax=Streptomyces sp. CB03238 TaxID=1907777 RepID=UPI0015C4A311|nr:ParA family protein [Streptomyces sp. CB03238]
MGKGKGGAGCTTAALELAYAASRRTRGGRPRRVGVLDLDPQGNATDVLEPATRAAGIKDVLAPADGSGRPVRLRDTLVPTAWANILVSPADRFLANREVDITATGMTALRRARISGELDDLVDDVVIDLPRHIGKLAATGLLGIEHLFITAQATMWGAQGAEEMRYTAQKIAEKGNPELRIAGFIVAAYEEGADASRVLQNMREHFGTLLLEPVVPRCSRVCEALESYHLPCREYGGADLESVADVYQGIYDRTLTQTEGTQ